MRQLGLFILIACLAAASGCNLCCWGKRNAELTGPTDIRKSQAWCLGEDALFHQPMGPSRENFGMKQTCWREWHSDGPACTDGSCAPAFTPSATSHQPQFAPQLVPPQQKPAAQGVDPFRDDAEPLPIPPQASTQPPAQPQRVRMAATASPTEFPTLFTPPLKSTEPAASAVVARPKPAAAKLPPRVVVKPAPPGNSALLAQQTTGAPAKNNPGRLQITVSDAIDVPPTRLLSPVAAPGTVVQSSLPAPASFQEAHETLAGLEQMVDVQPTTTDRNSAQPAVIRNEFAAPPKPFRLATRTSRPDPGRDPELERETLSALGDMFSGDAPASSDE